MDQNRRSDDMFPINLFTKYWHVITTVLFLLMMGAVTYSKVEGMEDLQRRVGRVEIAVARIPDIVRDVKDIRNMIFDYVKRPNK